MCRDYNVWVNSKSDHPPPGQTPGHLTFLKMPDQIPLYMGRFYRSNAPLVGAEKSSCWFFFFFFVFASSVYIKINEIHTLINLKQFIIKDNA